MSVSNEKWIATPVPVRRLKMVALYEMGPEETFSCDTCSDVETCPSSFDAYNIGGDCLEMK